MQDYKEGAGSRGHFILSGDSGSIITTLLDPRSFLASNPEQREEKAKETVLL